MRRILPILVLLLALASPAAASPYPGPALQVPEDELHAALRCPEAFTATDREPVLLVHGTFVDSDVHWSWSWMPALLAEGFDVCTVDVPHKGLGDIQVSAEYIVFAIREVSERSGSKVDVVGVSQGGLMPRWAIKWWTDIRERVDDLVMIATPNHGTYGRPPSGSPCFPSCWQMGRGSNFLAALNEGNQTPGDIAYTSIYTLFDELVQPQFPESTSALEGASNILIQDLCPARPTGHATITADAVAYVLALDALRNPGPTDPSRFDTATCMQTAMPNTDYPTGLAAFLGYLQEGAFLSGPYVYEEPPLAAYARAEHEDAEPVDEEEPIHEHLERAREDESHEAVIAAEAMGSTPGQLPSAGTPLLRIIAAALGAIATGLLILQASRPRHHLARGARGELDHG